MCGVSLAQEHRVSDFFFRDIAQPSMRFIPTEIEVRVTGPRCMALLPLRYTTWGSFFQNLSAHDESVIALNRRPALLVDLARIPPSASMAEPVQDAI